MLKSASGIILIPNDPQLKLSNWKDKGTFLNFRAVSQEASNGDKAKLHHYSVSMYVPNEEVPKWQQRLTPGQMFLLTNGSVSALIPDGKEYPFIQIKVDRNDLAFIKKAVTTGE
jgi:hypothetical protein